MIIMLWAFMKYIDKEPLINIGLQVKGRLKDFNFGLLIGLLIMGFAYFFLLLINEIVFVNIDFNFNKVLLSIVLFMGVSVFEEIIFRGYVLKNLLIICILHGEVQYVLGKQVANAMRTHLYNLRDVLPIQGEFNPYAALFVSSLFFSLIHGANPNVTLLGLSMLLCLFRPYILKSWYISWGFLCIY